MRSFFTKFARSFQFVSTVFLLHVAYFIGIGITSLVGRMFRVPFLHDSTADSTWIKHHDSEDLSKMF